MNICTLATTVASAIGIVLITACSPVGSQGISPSSVVPMTTAPATAQAPPAQTTPSSVTSGQGAEGCATYQNHLYEVCVAYVWNDAHASLQPYYKYVHSDSPLSFLKDRLAIKYQGDALRLVQQRTANWPQGTNTVDGPDITILSARSSLACNRAVLTTREDWTVRAPNDTILYDEHNQVHTIVLKRTPDERFQYDGQVLHQWVVDAIYDGAQNLAVC